MRILPVLVIAVVLLCAGCSVMAPLPTSAGSDPNVGGGQVVPSSPGGMGVEGGAGGGKTAPENNQSNAAPPAMPDAPLVDLPQVSQGETVQHSGLDFTIGLMEISDSRVFIQYTVSGFAPDYRPADEPVEAFLMLPDGRLLPPIGGKGSGVPGSETLQTVFPPLPSGTPSIQLLLENQWSGKRETWRVPVDIGR